MVTRITKNAKNLSAWFRRTPGASGIPRHRFTEGHFDLHTKTIGSVLLAWNDLHERLSPLFMNAMGANQWKRSIAIWHAARHDNAKRKLLRAAIENLAESDIRPRMRYPDGSLSPARPLLVQEILWLLTAVGKLEDWRDDTAHTPLTYSYIDILSLSNVLTSDILERIVAPHAAFANPRALKFQENNRDILVECRYARERILILRDYAVAIEHAWSNPPLPWPDRPALPERKPNRRSKAKVARRR
jgi:hypothetical protein